VGCLNQQQQQQHIRCSQKAVKQFTDLKMGRKKVFIFLIFGANI
jgi:hypothetical protein